MPKWNAEIYLKDGQGDTRSISYHAKDNTFDGSGWRGFLKGHNVSEGDGLVVSLVTGRTFQVYIVWRDGSDDFDGALSSEEEDDDDDDADNDGDDDDADNDGDDDDDGQDQTDNSNGEDKEDKDLLSVSTSSGQNSSGCEEDDSDVEIVGSELCRDGLEQIDHPLIHSNADNDSSSPLKTSSEVPKGGSDQIRNALMDYGTNVDKDDRSPSSALRTSSIPNNAVHSTEESHHCGDDREVPKRIRFSESNVEFKEVKTLRTLSSL